MKTIEAHWEKRNLGVTTTEFTVEQNDSWNDIESLLSDCKSDYQVLRVPSQMMDLIFRVQRCEFEFVEDIIYLRNDLREIEMDPITLRLYKSLVYLRMNEDDFVELSKEIQKGIFDSDRVYIDPYFDNHDSANRYLNWINDERKKGSLFFKFVYKAKTVGFVAFKDAGKGDYYAFLAGVYSNYKNSGLGAVIYGIDIIRDLNGRSIISVVSSNNAKQLRNMIRQGFVPEQVYHIFVRHNSKKRRHSIVSD